MRTRKPSQPAENPLAIEYLPVHTIHERAENARVHKPTQVRKIADSIRSFGFVVPALVDDDNVLLAGHGRLAAAKLLGLRSVPVVRVSGLSEAQRRALTLADNKLTDLSWFDVKKLKTEFSFLSHEVPEFQLESTGFDIVEIDKLMGADQAAAEQEEVEVPERNVIPVSRAGDLWLVGSHRILCGSALVRADVARLLANRMIDLTFTDPPYNVKIGGNVSGLGKVKHREFGMASGEMSRAEFTFQFLRPAFELIRDHSAPGAIAFVCMDWRHTRDVEVAAEGVFDEHKNTIVWVKSNAGMSGFYRSQHEMILAFKTVPGRNQNNFGLGAQGRHRSNVWQYPGVNTFRHGRKQDLESHPTVKNLKMVSDAILDCSSPNDVVFDGFLGSGTTALAAALTGRVGCGIELDPIYVDVILGRLTEGTGLVARLETGESLAEVAAARGVAIEEDA